LKVVEDDKERACRTLQEMYKQVDEKQDVIDKMVNLLETQSKENKSLKLELEEERAKRSKIEDELLEQSISVQPEKDLIISEALDKMKQLGNRKSELIRKFKEQFQNESI